MTIEANNVVVISDTHCGCRVGLCPPGGIRLDEGGTYNASKLQRKMWSMWREFWDEWIPAATKGEDFCVIMNGDALDGTPHQSKSNISSNLADQANIAYEVIAPVVEACGGRYWPLRGTEAHVGKSAENEEQLAQRLGAIPTAEGQASRYELRKRIGPKKAHKIIHALHHIGTTGRPASESSAVMAEMVTAYVESARWGSRPPSVVVRSHRHRNINIQFPAQDAIATHEASSVWSLTSPAWQARTPFVMKIPGGRLSTPQFGGVLIRYEDGEIIVRPKVWTIPQSRVE